MPEKVIQPNGPLKPVTHILFDMDGLLLGKLWHGDEILSHNSFLDSENYYTIAMNNITTRYGKEFTFDVKSRIERVFFTLFLSRVF